MQCTGPDRDAEAGELDEQRHQSGAGGLALDREQVERAVRGDEDALRALWSAVRRPVAAVLLARKPREAELEDLLQDVAAQMVAKIGTLEDPDAFLGWVRMLASNAAVTAGRRATVRRNGVRTLVDRVVRRAHEQKATKGYDEAGAIGGESGLVELVQELPEGYREPLLLRATRDMSYRQIACALDLPETTVETRITRGRRMLRELVRRRSAEQQAGARGGVFAGSGT